jgi:transcriptional regulator
LVFHERLPPGIGRDSARVHVILAANLVHVENYLLDPWYALALFSFLVILGQIKMTKPDSDLLQGTLDLLILKTLALQPMHGYGVSVRIQQMSRDILKVPQGSLYPALYRMEQRGLIDYDWGVSENGRKAKFYRLTNEGRKTLEEASLGWNRLSGAVTRILRTV